MNRQRTWGELAVGQRVEAVEFPLSLYRLVVAAGANRDFNSIHHNSEYAKTTGAGEAYANTLFLQGMWERTVREFIGDAGLIHSIRGFRMRSFNLAGETAVVSGGVARIWLAPEDTERGFAALTIQTSVGSRVTVGPGEVVVSVPRGQSRSV
jgi:acyl dehydratase